ncbi:hypothetical protein BZG35_10315 [Brevundimonas sp. LM2]|uniref:hypothetical protein n=1 Tax=Brevundimonas sp. LM2 TaxID=1938605 RepID=UPI000983B80B|nr:hypothetical protein [Brevundimonas sp. LM2]AQR61995.1 hypothetical protein BZG35_10315 [Brevundimonas sp. LM2]
MLDWALVGLWTLFAAYCGVRLIRDIRSGIASPDNIYWPKQIHRRHQPITYWFVTIGWLVGLVASGSLAIFMAIDPEGFRELLR